MRKITTNMYELEEYFGLNAQMLGFDIFHTTSWLDGKVQITGQYLYDMMKARHGLKNICYDIPSVWVKNVKLALQMELPILEKKLELCTYKLQDAKGSRILVDSVTHTNEATSNVSSSGSTSTSNNDTTKDYEKAPIDLDVSGNENYYSNQTTNDGLSTSTNEGEGETSSNSTDTTEREMTEQVASDFELLNIIKSTLDNEIENFVEVVLSKWFLMIY